MWFFVSLVYLVIVGVTTRSAIIIGLKEKGGKQTKKNSSVKVVGLENCQNIQRNMIDKKYKIRVKMSVKYELIKK
jgi:hypothetical protein